jgi:hypothetical protein
MGIKTELEKVELATAEAFPAGDDMVSQAKNKLLALLGVLEIAHSEKRSMTAEDIGELHDFVNDSLILLNAGSSE